MRDASQIRLRARETVLRVQAGLPDGQISHLSVQPSRKKYSARAIGQITFRTRAVSGHRGALANVINAAGDAVDADAQFDERR